MSVDSQQLPPFSRLFEELFQRQVQFTLFKGLDRIDAVLGGAQGDIDILLQAEMGTEVKSAFRVAGFYQDLDAIDQLDPTVTVYRAFDPESAQFAMVHAYEQLLLGDRMQFRYGYESDLLLTSEERNGYRVVAPAHEWLIRAFNDLAKRNFDDPYLVSLGAKMGTDNSMLNDGLHRYVSVGFLDLLTMFQRGDVQGLAQLRRSVFGSDPADVSLAERFVRRFTSRVRAGWNRTPVCKVRNKIGVNRLIVLRGPSAVLNSEVATQIATQLAPVARVKRLHMDRRRLVSPISWINDHLNRLRMIL